MRHPLANARSAVAATRGIATRSLCIALVAAGYHSPAAAWTHVRPLGPGAVALVAEAARRSAIVRAQLEALERSDVVVYVADHDRDSPALPDACLAWVTRAGNRRYVLVRVAPWRTAPQERISWLGHELQHALEIAADRDVQDAAGLVRLYNRIGWAEAGNRFESDAARTVSRLIRDELAGFRVDPERVPGPPGLDGLAPTWPGDPPTARD